MRGNRPQRIAELVQAELAQLIRSEIKDPRVGMVSITHCEVTRDLGLARVYVTPLGGLGDSAGMLKGLTNAAGFLRGLVGRRLKLRRAPQIEFRLDDSTDEAVRMTTLLGRMEREREARQSEGEE